MPSPGQGRGRAGPLRTDTPSSEGIVHHQHPVPDRANVAYLKSYASISRSVKGKSLIYLPHVCVSAALSLDGG